MIGANSHEPQIAPDGGWLTRERALVLVLIAATALALFLCFLLVRPFLPAVAWALALAVIARPLHQWIAERVRNPDLAAGLAVGLVAVMLIAPTILIMQNLVQEATAFIGRLETSEWPGPLQESSTLASLLRWAEEHVDWQRETEQLIVTLAGDIRALVNGSLWVGTQLLITLFALYYFFRDRQRALRALRSLVPLSESEADEAFVRVADTIHATIFGTVLVAIVQGSLGGFMFWLLGLPAPILWGMVMGLLAIVPYLGAFIVWVPAALILALQGHWISAAILTAWGSIVIGLIDNLLYPMLVGKKMRLHTLLVFFAIIGGLAVFGASGVILGPVVLAVTDALVDIWRRRTSLGRTAEMGVKASTNSVVAEVLVETRL